MRISSVLGALAALALFSKSNAEPLKVGDSAPDVTGITENGTALDLGSLYKKGFTLVYFYPKADTPGCTAQGCSLRDEYAALADRGITVIGVSADTVEAQKKFKEKYNLPFTLIADPEHKVIDAFGVPLRHVPAVGSFATRQAYLIDRKGKVVWCDYKASTREQAHDVLKALASL